jgi:hypothetical protein
VNPSNTSQGSHATDPRRATNCPSLRVHAVALRDEQKGVMPGRC